MLTGAYLLLLRLSSDSGNVCESGRIADKTEDKEGTGAGAEDEVVGTGGGDGNREMTRVGGNRGG